jgi:type III secretory pathway component EscU
MFDYSAVNWLAVIIAAVANIVISTVWYLPQVFGKQWSTLLGREMNTGGNPMLYAIAIIGSLISAYVLALIVNVSGATSVVEGAVTGLLVSIGFIATTQAVGGAFEGRSWTLFGINAGNSLVAYAVMGAILAAMG